jgi:tripartite-type tricarboxylate transporter receptor subunit TctC
LTDGRLDDALSVHPSFPAKTVPEFIAHAKANPGKVNMASAGNGTPPHLVGALFQAMAAVNMVHVPYRGAAPALTDLIGGQVQVMFVGSAVAVDHVKSGRETVEHPFGTMKARMGATHFLMKTLPKVAAEMALSVLAYNLTRVINIVGVKPLIAAIGA